MQRQSDESLVAEVQEGSIAAFEELVNRYQRKLLGFAVYIVRDRELAQDVVQESLILLYKTIDRVDTSKKFSSYLYAMTRNSAISALRRQKHTITLEDIAHLPALESVDEQYIKKEKKTWIRAALRELDAKYHKVISLYYFEDLSYEEISKRMHLPVNTIRTHLRRAKAALRKVLRSV